MMDFIMVPIVVGIVCTGIYGLFELFVRRKERMAIIEKIGDKLDASAFEGKFKLPAYRAGVSFNSLKVGCLLSGVGFGLLIGFIFNIILAAQIDPSVLDDWSRREMAGICYGASVLLFGGIALLIAFLIEMKMAARNK
jgi:hypothetical protein